MNFAGQMSGYATNQDLPAWSVDNFRFADDPTGMTFAGWNFSRRLCRGPISSRNMLSVWYAPKPMRLYQSVFFLAAIAVSVFAQNLKPAADRLTAQNALFEEQYESDLRNFPERATAFGDYRYNDKLNDYSLAAIAQQPQDGRDLP